MKALRAVLAALLLVSAASEAANYLEVRRDATIYAEPNKKSDKLAEVAPGQTSKPVLLTLVTTEKSNGYHQVKIPDSNKRGWIYKTYVRPHPGPDPRYTVYRRSDYKHWVDADGDCQNARDEVLIRDATGQVTFEKPRKCVVVGGMWVDPYTGETFKEPRQLDIDHVVPLKNAHESGAWKWSAEKRQEYANYLKDRQHLLAVKASENRKKGSKGPEGYLPPDTTYHCDYVKEWVKIKKDWGLSMTVPETHAVKEKRDSCSGSAGELVGAVQ